MENYYKILGINSSATPEEIRRAYRILARRYHPDVNPGESNAQKFRLIADAHTVLSDPEKRRNFDIELESEHQKKGATAEQAYRRAARAAAQFETRRRFQNAQARAAAETATSTTRPHQPTVSELISKTIVGAVKKLRAAKTVSALGEKNSHAEKKTQVQKVSVVEVSLSLRDAISGIKKTIEISEPEGSRKVSVRIPPGSRNGTVVHLRSTHPTGEELVLIVRVAAHPTMSLLQKGLVVEIPITVTEAVCGASITVPTLDEPISLKVPAGTQSGTELRVRERGVLQKDGSRGDLFYRLLIRIPDSIDAVGLKEKSQELNTYYGDLVRQKLPKVLLDT